MKFSFNLQDASQIFVGAFAPAVPIPVSEEAWRLAEMLPVANLFMLFDGWSSGFVMPASFDSK